MNICEEEVEEKEFKWVAGHIYLSENGVMVFCIVEPGVVGDHMETQVRQLELYRIDTGQYWSSVSNTELQYTDVTDQYCLKKVK